MSSRHILGFSGPMGSGKTAAAQHLVKTYDFTRVRFAAPLKAMLAALGLTTDELDGHLKEEPCELLSGKTPRWAQKSLGTEWGRQQIHGDLWVNAWKRALPEGNIVADDVRFPNEVKAIRDLGGAVIRICRPGHEPSDHISEQGVECDHMIGNDDNLEDLFNQIDHFLLFERMGL